MTDEQIRLLVDDIICHDEQQRRKNLLQLQAAAQESGNYDLQRLALTLWTLELSN